MRSTLRKRIIGLAVGITALLNLGTASAQMDIALVATADPEVYEFHWTANAAYSGIMNSVFSIRWDASAGGEISEDDFVNLCSNTRAPLLTNDLPVEVVGGFRYYTFRCDGASSLGTTAQCGFSAGQTRALHRFRIVGISGCPNIGLTNDQRVTDLNRDYFVSVGGVASTGNFLTGQLGVPFTVTPGSYGPACSTGADITLGGSPAGGTWSGTGVTGSTFDPSAGTQTLTYTVTQGSCTVSANTTVSVSTVSTPTISAGGATTFCAGGSVVLTSSSATGNVWSPGGQTTHSITVTAGGTYSVTVTSGGCSATSAGTTVTVNPLPAVPTISAGGATTFCAGGSVVLTSSSATGNVWSPGGQTTQSITVTAGGTYSVTVTSGGCSRTSTGTTVTVNPLPAVPTISAGGATTFCAGGSVVLTSSSATGNVWSPGGQTTQSITVTAGGTYSVTVTSGGCSRTSTGTTVTVNPNPATPTISAGGATTFCAGGSVVLTSSSATGNVWSPGGQTTQSITVTAGGTYSVTVTSGGCSATSAGTTVTVNPNPATPTISAGGATTFCAGGSVVLTSSSATGNVWSPGGQTTQSITVTAGGTYSVTVTSGGCSATSAGTTVTVNPNPATPTISAGGATTFCAGGSVVLTSSSATGNVWSPGGQTTQSITVTAGGTYSVTVTSGGCSATSAGTTVTVNPNPATPTISAGGATTFCAGGSVVLTSSSATGNVWSPGGQTTQSITVTAGGTYSVTVTSGGCSATSAGTTVTVNPNPATPTISAGGATTFCAGGSVVLTSSSATGNVWSPGGQTTQSITVTAGGTYSVTVTSGGCSATSAGTTVTATATSSNTTTITECDSYTWAVNGTTYTQSGTYTDVDGCHTEILVLTIVTSTNNTTTVSECDSYTWNVNGTTYTQSGTYTSVSGCGTQTLVLTITPSSSNTTTISECDSYTWTVNGTTYTQSGTYTDVEGCHTETLVLTITPSSSNTTTLTECDSYTWAVNGTTYTQSGTYTDVDGCHTETLVLTIVTSTNNTTTVSECDSYTWNVNGTTYTQSGTYTSVSGCGTQTLVLTITPSSSNTTTLTECDSYTWAVNGTTYTQSGTYTDVEGCHTETLVLTIVSSTNNTTTVSECDSYTWNVNGTTYTQSGTYTSVSGCGTQTLVLTITPSSSNTTTLTECDSYTWAVNGTTYTQSGTYTDVDGCHTETLVLTIVSSTNNTTTVSECDSYTWNVNGTTYTQSGTYTSVSGCGTQTLVLTITPSSTNTTEIDACGTSFTWAVNGTVYTQSGTYTSLNGCVTEVLELTLTVPGTACDDGNAGTENDTWSQNCTCVGEPIGCDQFVNLVINTDANGGQTTWEIIPEGGGTALCQGGPYTGINNTVLGEQCCLSDGCYALRVYDSAGDGMTTGGYVLKEGGAAGRRIIDNTGDGVFGAVSAISGGQGFCLPIGDDRLIYSNCDRDFWLPNQYAVATENVAVSATWVPGGANSVQPSNSGYEFWIYDPDGTYSFRRFRSHNVSDGFSPATALRACHMKINSWLNTVSTPHIPSGVLMNIRIRGRVAGSNFPFGPACRFKIDPTLALCPPTSLVSDPQSANFSCGAIKRFGVNTSRIYAWARTGANRYQYEFTLPGEGSFTKVVTSNNQVCILNWTVDPLLNGVTYNVRVRVSMNAGATWCPWGETCLLTINNNPSGITAEPAALPTIGAVAPVFTAWPNPNRGDRLMVNITDLPASVDQVGVEVYDLTGKKVMGQMIATQDGGVLNTNIELGLERSGVYLLRVTAGSFVTTERIVVQH